MMSPIRTYLQREKKELEILLRSIPASVVTLFVVSVICMNLLANKTLLQLEWIALDGGILISWLSFLCMDVMTKHFGPKASTRISVLAAGINLLSCVIFFVASVIPSNARDYSAFNDIFGGTWFILLGSTLAFLLSAGINNALNWFIGTILRNHPDGRFTFAVQSYISTFVGQFFDNFIFSVIVFVWLAPVFWEGFSWTVIQCATCALTGAVLELLMEVVFSPFGYRMVQKWKKNEVGKEYLDYIAERRK